MNAFLAWAKRPIPVTFEIIAFAFFEGAALSFPIALLLDPIRFDVPDLTRKIVIDTALVGLLTLPVCCLLLWRKQRALAKFGLATFIPVVVWVLLYPAL